MTNGAKVLARSHPTASLPNAPLAAVVDHGAGRVVVSADSDLFGDDCIGELDHRTLWINLLYWAAQPGFAGTDAAARSAVLDDPAWIRLKAAVEELRLTQSPDGSVDTVDSTTPTSCATSPSRSPSRRRRSSRASPTRRSTSTPSPPTCSPGPTAATPSPRSTARPRPSAPSASAATASSTSA